MVTHDDRRLAEVHSFIGNIAEARSRNTGLQSREAQHMIDKQMKACTVYVPSYGRDGHSTTPSA